MKRTMYWIYQECQFSCFARMLEIPGSRLEVAILVNFFRYFSLHTYSAASVELTLIIVHLEIICFLMLFCLYNTTL